MTKSINKRLEALKGNQYMNQYKEILNYFSSGNNCYHIKKYDLDIYYVGYNGCEVYAHEFYLGKDNHTINFAVIAPTEDPKDIHLIDFREAFAKALTRLFDMILGSISQHIEQENLNNDY